VTEEPGTAALIDAVSRLRAEVEETVFGLDLPGSGDARATRQELLDQFDDYLLPRLSSLEAPLLAVVGGSTGAGKSTLVNSIVGSEVSRSGVIRPTTTSPVLVHCPDDTPWFADRRILPGLARVTGSATGEPQPGTVQLVSSTDLPPGMALLDAPDIDSVVHAHRELATQLLAAADLWLFVTTAARYADAVPWELLRTASERGTAVAIVLDRVPPEIVDEVRPHLVEMLRDQGLATTPIFTIPETTLTADGALPDSAMGRLRAWLHALAGDARARAIIVEQTLRGAVESLGDRTARLEAASEAQAAASGQLLKVAAGEFEAAEAAVREGMTDGTLLRGEVLARWQEFVGTGEFFRQVESTVGKWRDRVAAAVKGEVPPSGEHLDEALQTGVAALLRAHADSAAIETSRAWRRMPGGDTLLGSSPELARASEDVDARIERLVRDWQGEVLDLVRGEGGSRRTNARIAAYGVNGIGLFLMLVSFAHTGGLVGGEIAIAGGTSVLAQKILEAIFGDQAVRTMADKARELLLGHASDLYTTELARYTSAVDSLSVSTQQAGRLAEAAERVREVNR
jgi:GTPase SAR1 family protein